MSVLGLDFGDSGAEMAYSLEGVATLLGDPARPSQTRLSNVVAIEDQVAWVGQPARDRSLDLPRIKCISGLKRALGNEDVVHTDSSGRHWQPAGLVALPIRKLLRDYASQHAASEPSVIAGVPAGADVGYVKALRSACRLAGFSAVDTVPEPVAITMASRPRDSGGLFLVLDAGNSRPMAALVRLDAPPQLEAFELGDVAVPLLWGHLLPHSVQQRLPPWEPGSPQEFTDNCDRLDSLWDTLAANPAGWSGLWRTADDFFPYSVPPTVAAAAQQVVGLELWALARKLLSRPGCEPAQIQRVICAGCWGRTTGVQRVLERQASQAGVKLQFSGAPAGAAAVGALLWHLRGHSRLHERAPGLIGIRTQDADGVARIEPVIRPGVALPASNTFPLYAVRAGQTRFVFELAEVDAAGQDTSQGFFTFECPQGVPRGHRLDCRVRLASDTTLQVDAFDPLSGNTVQATLGAAEIDDHESFERHSKWIARLGINDACAFPP